MALIVLPALASEAGTLDDMELRSNVEAGIRGTAQTATLHLKVRVEDHVAIPEGVIRDLNQADDVVAAAAKVKGITAVLRSGLRLEFGGVTDDEVASSVTRTLFESPRYASSSIRIAVDHGVVTLTGTIANASWRSEIRKICGGIGGVVDLVDDLETPEVPDPRIQKALDAVFGVRVVPRFPGRVRASVRNGVVDLEGHAPNLYDKQLADKAARAINGVRAVDDRIELASGQSVKVIDP